MSYLHYKIDSGQCNTRLFSLYIRAIIYIYSHLFNIYPKCRYIRKFNHEYFLDANHQRKAWGGGKDLLVRVGFCFW